MTKSYVTMETAVCPVCGKQFDTGALLLDRRMRSVFEDKTCVGWKMCEEHQKLKDGGYVALVSVDHDKSVDRGGNITPESAWRTGQIAHVRLPAFEEIFGTKAPKGGLAFCDDELIAKLQDMMPASEAEAEKSDGSNS